MAEQVLQHLVPIVGAGYAILPEVALRGGDLFKNDRYAQAQRLKVLPLKPIFKTARAVKPSEPTEAFRKYAREVDGGLKADAVDEAYSQLHNQIWEQYFIRAKEVLIWSRPTMSVHPRVVAGKQTLQLKSTLLKDYRAAEDNNFDVSGIQNPTLEVQWQTENGPIPKALAELFDADPETFVYTNTDTNIAEGLRALDVGFWDREWPDLYSDRGPLVRDSDGGSLLGRKIAQK